MIDSGLLRGMLIWFLSGMPVKAHPGLDVDVVQEWLDAVVLLTNNGAFCSGAWIDDSGTILTAYHCVASGRDTTVRTRDGKEYRAGTIAVDVSHDLALISVDSWSDSPKIHPFTVQSQSPSQGETIYALGHPLAPYARKPMLQGTLQWSMSDGIVSAIGERLIQVDAPLNPGNSGGPIVNLEGEIIGVASRKLRGDNLSFLGPATAVASMIEDPQAQTWWGGQLSVGFGYQVPLGGQGLPIWTGHIETFSRDRWVLGLQTRLQPNVSIVRSAQWVPANALRLSRRARFGVGEVTSFVDVGLGATHQWYALDNRHDILPTAHIRTGFGTTALRYELLGFDDSPIWSMTVEMNVPGVIQVF